MQNQHPTVESDMDHTVESDTDHIVRSDQNHTVLSNEQQAVEPDECAVRTDGGVSAPAARSVLEDAGAIDTPTIYSSGSDNPCLDQRDATARFRSTLLESARATFVRNGVDVRPPDLELLLSAVDRTTLDKLGDVVFTSLCAARNGQLGDRVAPEELTDHERYHALVALSAIAYGRARERDCPPDVALTRALDRLRIEIELPDTGWWTEYGGSDDE